MSWSVTSYIFVTLLHIHIVTSCKGYLIQGCSHFNRISSTSFQAFIPIQEHMLICSELSSALRCALDNQYTNGCKDEMIIPYQSQYNVMKVVCTDRKQDYFNSEKCFLSENLKQDIQECLTTASYMMAGDDICEKIEETRDCVYNKMEERQETCSGSSKFLMGKLVFLYLKPRGHNCNIELREGEEDPTTTTSTTQSTTTTTTSTTQSTTTTTTTTALTTDTPRALEVRETQQPGEGFGGAVALLPSMVFNSLVSLVLIRLLG